MNNYKMGAEKLLLTGILLIFLITSVSAVEFEMYVEVKNATAPNNPIPGASVTISGHGSSWQRLTNAQGRTPEIVQSLPATQYYFDITVTKEGFQTRTLENVELNVLPIPLQTYKLATVLLTASSACNNNGVCEASIGETTENCPADCPPPSLSSGMVSDIRIEIQSGTSPVQCPENYAEAGAFNDNVFNRTHKLCVKYEAGFVAGNVYVTTAYLAPYLGGPGDGEVCEEGSSPVGTPFAGLPAIYGSSYMTLCVGKANIHDITEEYVTNVEIVNAASCTSQFNRASPSIAFTDRTGGLHRMCTKIQNYAGEASGCQLTNPQWMISNPLQQIITASGWVGLTTSCRDVNYGEYEYQNGTRDVIMYVQAPGCMNEQVKFEIYEDTSTVPGTGTIKQTIQFSDWQSDGGGRSYASWCPEWAPASLGNPDADKYYSFKAIIEGSTIQSPFSGSLTVKKPPVAECQYQEYSNTDDEVCRERRGDDFVCVQGNYCSSFQCSSSQDCRSGEICCPAGESNCRGGTCVQCYRDSHCASLANFGEDSTCNLTSNKCIGSCEITKPSWISQAGNELPLIDANNNPIIYPGFINTNDYQRGIRVNIEARAVRCENMEDIIFVVTEKRGLIQILNRRDPGVILDDPSRLRLMLTPDSGQIQYIGYEPSWAISLNLQGTDFLQYRVYAAYKSDPGTPISPYSDTIYVGKPDVAQCRYTEESDSDDEECFDKYTYTAQGVTYSLGRICSPDNICINQCESNADCTAKGLPPICAITQDGVVGAMFRTNEDAPSIFNAMSGAISGRCYECFNNNQCAFFSAIDPERKYCAPADHQKKFRCVKCYENSHCPTSEDGTPGICLNGECTITCDPTKDSNNPNIDCQTFQVTKTEEELNAMSRQARADGKGKEICDPELKVCVQCNDNWNGRTKSGCTEPGSCCWEGTACLIERGEPNRCVQCIEDSICGPGNHCNKETNKCESGTGGFGGEGGLGGIAIAAIAAFAGFMFMGPMGAIAGGLLGLLAGGGLGGGGGLIGGLGGLSGIGSLLGGIGS